MAIETQDTAINDWKKKVDEFYSKADAKLEEVHKCKQELEQLKVDILNQINNGQYYSDDKCIIISAPRIIIGNVSKDGTLKAGGGEVIIKGTSLGLDGVGSGGEIAMRAPVIRQEAVDPGIDGREAVVYNTAKSVISSQARSIVINSQSPKADGNKQSSFLPLLDTGAGVTVVSERGITLAATVAAEKKKKAVDKQKTALTNSINDIKSKIDDVKDALHQDMEKMDEILKDGEKMTEDCDLTRANILAIDELNALLREKMPDFNRHLLEYTELVAKLAEANRQKANMETEAQAAVKPNYKDKYTGSKLTLKSEKIELHNIDGDGNWRVNEGSGIDLMGNDIKIRSMMTDSKGNNLQLTPKDKKGKVTIQARTIDISTANIDGAEYDKGKIKTATFPLEGEVTIQSKTISMQAVNQKQTDTTGKMEEVALTEGGAITMRAEKVDVRATTTKGEATGSVDINAKELNIKAMNVDDKGNDKELADGSKMTLLAQTIRLGHKDKELKQISKKVMLASEERTTLASKKKLAVSTDEADLVLEKNEIKLRANGKTTISAKDGTTYMGKSTFTAKVTGKSIEADNLTAKKALKGPNTADGTAMPGPEGSTAPAEKINDVVN